MGRLAQYFERLPTPAYLWKARGDELILEAANRAAREVTGEAIGSLIGCSADALYSDQPDVIADLKRCLAGETFTREYSYRMRSTGQVRDVIVTLVDIPPNMVVVHAQDVTDGRRVQAELRKSHEAARAILEASSQPILLLDATGSVLAMNSALGRFLQMPEDSILDSDVFELLPPESAVLQRAAVERVLRTGEPFQIEDEMWGRYFRRRIYPVRDDGGDVARVVVYYEDHTDHRRVQAELVRRRKSHQQAQRIAHLGHWELELESGRLRWSDEVYRIFGVARGDFPGTSEAFVERVHPADRAVVGAVLGRAVREGKPYSVEHRVVRPDGSTRIVRERTEATEDAVGGVTLIGTVLDITELKEAERAAREHETDLIAVMEGNPDGICLLASGIQVCNTSLSTLLGRPKEELIGQRLTRFMTPKDRLRARRRARSILEGVPGEPAEYTLERPDRTLLPVEIFSARTEFRGEPALICTIRDVRARKEAEREIAESHAILQSLIHHLENVREQERAQVARDLHDELGSVLTALKIDLVEAQARSVAGEGVGRESLAEMVDLLDEAIDVGRRVTARLRPGILDDFGLCAALEWLADGVQQRAGIACRVDLPATEVDLPDALATAMFRIGQEALTNVVRHSGSDRMSISLNVDETSVSLTVADYGEGFDPSGGAGSRGGFGLHGMRERIRAFGGRVEVTSEPGEGTTVHVVAPLNGSTSRQRIPSRA